MSVHKLPNENWIVKWRIKNPTFKPGEPESKDNKRWKQESRVFMKKTGENGADAFDNEVHNKLRKGTHVSADKIPTVAEACAAFLLMKENTISPKKHRKRDTLTIAYWRNHCDRWIVPSLGNYKVNEVSDDLAFKVMSVWSKKIDGTTVNKIRTTGIAVFERYLGKGVTLNPFKAAEQVVSAKERDDTNDEGDIVQADEVYNEVQLRQIYTASEDEQSRLFLWVAAKTGLRHGEILGLRESDVVDGEVRVRQQFKGTYDSGHNPRFVKLKSLTRDIPIPDDLVSAIELWKVRNPESKYGLLFCKASGEPLTRKDGWKIFQNALRKLPTLPVLSMHALRHSFASILLNKGKPSILVQKLMGHASVATTLRTYAHFIKDVVDYKPESDPVQVVVPQSVSEEERVLH